MASKRRLRRKHERVSCKGKIGFNTEAGANTVARKRRERTGEEISAYHCSICGKWHHGHTPGQNSRYGDE